MIHAFVHSTHDGVSIYNPEVMISLAIYILIYLSSLLKTSVLSWTCTGRVMLVSDSQVNGFL